MKIKIKETEVESFLELPAEWECKIEKSYSGKTWICTCTFGSGYNPNLVVKEEHRCKTEATTQAFRKACIIVDALKEFEA